MQIPGTESVKDTLSYLHFQFYITIIKYEIFWYCAFIVPTLEYLPGIVKFLQFLETQIMSVYLYLFSPYYWQFLHVSCIKSKSCQDLLYIIDHFQTFVQVLLQIVVVKSCIVSLFLGFTCNPSKVNTCTSISKLLPKYIYLHNFKENFYSSIGYNTLCTALTCFSFLPV